jgi:transposase-like protein
MEATAEPGDWTAGWEEPEERRRRARFSARPCPRCGEEKLMRRRRPLHLRIARVIGLNIARYHCKHCNAVLSLRRK